MNTADTPIAEPTIRRDSIACVNRTNNNNNNFCQTNINTHTGQNSTRKFLPQILPIKFYANDNVSINLFKCCEIM